MKTPESLRQLKEKSWVHAQFWITQTEVNEWVDQTRFAFVLAIGRSGTAFLARLLDQAEGAVIAHEPVALDYAAHQRAYASPADAVDYLENFRKKEIFLRMRRQQVSVYGEVNSLLRRHAQALSRAFPTVRLFHLVRDGRDVVRSMMNRNTFLPSDRHTRAIAPLEHDPWKGEWQTMDRFARLCWYWQVENAYLRQNIDSRVQFESLLSDYDYFEARLLQPLGLRLSKATWSEQVRVPQNTSGSYQMPRWEEWSPEQQQIFIKICGEEMKANGYNC